MGFCKMHREGNNNQCSSAKLPHHLNGLGIAVMSRQLRTVVLIHRKGVGEEALGQIIVVALHEPTHLV